MVRKQSNEQRPCRPSVRARKKWPDATGFSLRFSRTQASEPHAAWGEEGFASFYQGRSAFVTAAGHFRTDLVSSSFVPPAIALTSRCNLAFSTVLLGADLRQEVDSNCPQQIQQQPQVHCSTASYLLRLS